MRKLTAVFFLFTIFLTSCNLPQQQAPSKEDVATAVAETLTSQPVEILQETATQVTITEPPAATETAAPEQTATPTVSPSPTPTKLADDPAVAFGEPAWQRTMVEGASFGIGAEGYEDENSRIVVENGFMTISSSSIYGFRGWRLSSPTPQNMYLEATFITQNCSGADSYGLVARAKDYSSGQGYYFGINCDGKYFLTKWDDGGTTVLINPKSDEAISPGTNQTHRIGILTEGDNLKLYINGNLLEEVTDSSIPDAGHIGVFISGYSGNLTVDMDEIAYWDLP